LPTFNFSSSGREARRAERGEIIGEGNIPAPPARAWGSGRALYKLPSGIDRPIANFQLLQPEAFRAGKGGLLGRRNIPTPPTRATGYGRGLLASVGSGAKPGDLAISYISRP